MGTLTITELSERTGLASSALRFYEWKGLLRSVGREGGKRIFDDAVVQHIAVIDLLKIAGFTLAEAASIVGNDGRFASDWRDRAQRKNVELAAQQSQIERAKAMLQHYIECPAPNLDECPVHRAIVSEHAKRLPSR